MCSTAQIHTITTLHMLTRERFWDSKSTEVIAMIWLSLESDTTLNYSGFLDTVQKFTVHFLCYLNQLHTNKAQKSTLNCNHLKLLLNIPQDSMQKINYYLLTLLKEFSLTLRCCFMTSDTLFSKRSAVVSRCFASSPVLSSNIFHISITPLHTEHDRVSRSYCMYVKKFVSLTVRICIVKCKN